MVRRQGAPDSLCSGTTAILLHSHSHYPTREYQKEVLDHIFAQYRDEELKINSESSIVDEILGGR